MAQVRAFVTAADRGHVGRAAAELSLTQQAVSKRIQRLEHLLGTELFSRGARSIELTAAGQRFLPHARELLAAAEAAVADARLARRPVRVDVWGHIHAPLARIRELAMAAPGDVIEISERRSTPMALAALLRGELDIAFGRVRDLGQPWPPQLAHGLIELTPGVAVASSAGPLAGSGPLPAAQLAGARLWAPAAGTSPEMSGWWRRVAERFGMTLETAGTNLGLPHAITDLKAGPHRAAIIGTPTQVPGDRGVCVRPITGPVPRYPWSAVWRQGDHDRAVVRLVRTLAEVSRTQDRAGFDPERDWLPEPDLADVAHRGAVPRQH
jgi:DNA-binding transcriptional LysR family regulator